MNEREQVPEDLVEWVESPQIQSTFVEIKKTTGANYLVIGNCYANSCIFIHEVFFALNFGRRAHISFNDLYGFLSN